MGGTGVGGGVGATSAAGTVHAECGNSAPVPLDATKNAAACTLAAAPSDTQSSLVPTEYWVAWLVMLPHLIWASPKYSSWLPLNNST